MRSRRFCTGSQSLGTRAGLLRLPAPLPALPRPQHLTLLQGDEHAARQPALLEEPSQLRRNWNTTSPAPLGNHKPLPASSSPCPSEERDRGRQAPNTIGPQPAISGYTCSLLQQHHPALLNSAPSAQAPSLWNRKFHSAWAGLPLLGFSCLFHTIPASTVSPPHPPRARAQGRPFCSGERRPRIPLGIV